MVGVLWRSSLRYFLFRPAQLILSILGIVLGVALVTAVFITNASSSKAFEQSVAVLTGPVSHRITGGSTGVAETDYVNLMRTTNLRAVPVITGYLQISNELFTVQGRDFVAELGAGTSRFTTPTLPTNTWLDADGFLISSYTQQRLQLPVATDLPAELNGQRGTLRISGEFQTANPVASDGMLIGDIGTVQQLFNRQGYIDSIDLILTDTEADELARRLPQHLQLNPVSRQLETMNEMTRGFQLNLTAMSLLALLIGGFLIHNSMTFSVLQRRRIFAIQRLLGTTSRQLFWLIGAEVAVISAVGSMLGIATGFALAHYLIELTTRTVNDLYFVLHIRKLWFEPVQFLMLMSLGIGTSLLAALASANEAAAISPIQATTRSRAETRKQHWLPVTCSAGIAIAVTGSVLAWLPVASLVVGFAAMMLFIAGYGLVIPWTVHRLTRWLHRLLVGLHPVLSMIAGSIHQNISRTGLAIAALTIALSATLGVEMMIGSFRHSVKVWLSSTLQSDIYVSIPSVGAGGQSPGFSREVIHRLQTLDSVENLSTARSATIDTEAGQIRLLALQPHEQSQAGYEILDGDAQAAWRQFIQSDTLLISEPLANRLTLTRGNTLNLFTDTLGFRDFTIAGVYRDYGSSHGRITMTRDTYLRFWNDDQTSSIGINLTPGVSADSIMTKLRLWSQEENQQWLINANDEIREESLRVFDQTFQVTSVLRLLTVAVAFIGVFSALLALQLEKSRDVAVLRAVGFTPGQTTGLVLGQTLLMGLLAGVLALPLGWIMSEILIHVINLRSFGWSMQSQLPAAALLETLMLALASAGLAGLYPMWRLSRRKITGLLRDE